MALDYFVAPDRLETPQFVVRSYQPGDGALLSEAVNASYDHLRTYMPWAVRYQTPEVSERLCRQWRGRYLLATEFVLGIWRPDEGLLLGGTGYHLRDGGLGSGNAEIGMWIRADHAGHGLGTAVLRALLAWGFAGWPWQRLAWHCDSRNGASARTAEKAGMQREGVLRGNMLEESGRRDTIVFGALRGEWHA